MGKRLIDANELVPYLWALFKFFGSIPCTEADKATQRGIKRCIGEIEKMPTVDAVEVVHGRWEWYADRCEDLFLGCDEDYGWRCSSCKVTLDDEDNPEVVPTFRYCPNCGAKMDGGADNARL